MDKDLEVLHHYIHLNYEVKLGRRKVDDLEMFANGNFIQLPRGWQYLFIIKHISTDYYRKTSWFIPDNNKDNHLSMEHISHLILVILNQTKP